MRFEDLLLGAGLALSRGEGLRAFRGFLSATMVLCTTSYMDVSHGDGNCSEVSYLRHARL
jgi:hypothetical protein